MFQPISVADFFPLHYNEATDRFDPFPSTIKQNHIKYFLFNNKKFALII